MEKLIQTWNEAIKKIMNKHRLRFLFELPPEIVEEIVSLQIVSADKDTVSIFMKDTAYTLGKNGALTFWSNFFRMRNIDSEELEKMKNSIRLPHFLEQVQGDLEEKAIFFSSFINEPVCSVSSFSKHILKTNHTCYFVVKGEKERFDLFKSCVIEDIDDSWFNTSMISKLTGMDHEFLKAHAESLDTMSVEFKRESLLEILNSTCGVDAFCHELIKRDGYAYWLNSVDKSTEIIKDDYYLYQIS